MGNWIKETFEVLWNWFMEPMVQSIAVVDVLLAIFPLILFVASRILSAVNSQYLKRLEEEENKTIQKQIEERDKQIKTIQKQIEEHDKEIHEIIVETQTLVQENERLKREIKTRKEENARLKSKLPAHVLEKCAFASELVWTELREASRKNP